MNTSGNPLYPSLVHNNGNNGDNNIPPYGTVMSFTEIVEEDNNIRDFLEVLRRRSLIIVGVSTAVMSGVVGLTLQQETIYEGRFQLLVEPVKDDSLPKITDPNQGSGQKSELDYETQIEVLKSPELMKGIVKQIQVTYPEVDQKTLLGNLTINRVGETKIIEVRYRNTNPDKVKTILDKVSNAYLEYSREDRQSNLKQGLNFVKREQQGVQTRVDRLQRQLQIFRQRNNFIDPDSQQAQIANQIKLLSEQRLNIEQRLAKAQSEYSRLQTVDGAQAVLRDADTYKNIVNQIRQAEAEIAKELTRFREDSIQIEILRERRENLLPLLEQEARRILGIRMAEAATELQTLQRQQQQLLQTQSFLERQIKQLPILAREYTELQQKLKVATESLNRLSETREKLQIEVAQKETQWRIVEEAVQPENPTSPNIPRNVILGLVASTLMGISAALILEKLDTTYHSVDALKEKTKLPLLGTIPFQRKLNSKKRNKRLPGNQQQEDLPLTSLSRRRVGVGNGYGYDESSKFLDALRVLYTNIQLLSCDRPISSLVISSALPGDGKSTLAFHLALTACAMGRRVLLVDANLRRPTIHDLAQTSNLGGLSSLIAGSLPAQEAIVPMPGVTELSILSAGPTPPDPAKLLSSMKMRQLMEEFKRHYDLVIYDTPPLAGLADASLLASATDGMILAVSMEKTDRKILQQTLESLKMSQIPLLGMVANRVKNDLLGDNYYSYHVDVPGIEVEV
ncbi:GumC family protein [Calothrix sp. NIES-3974]|uniref:GumC family protein n=1 Tax=Calothrix sp. NIES-3974 TaxID=2005462 RepID=UPI000B61D3B9|nr:polysaccharide biosynthesis tyrosine autokinase [Calothrix sp. NIES-3974]BAZ03588.1 capsular exopolysaccharide family protein [Calothrix sp. NIES-3974]